MSERRTPWTSNSSLGHRHRVEQNALLRDRVGHHLATLEQVLDSLRRELAEAHERNRSLLETQGRLQQELLRAELLRAAPAESEPQLRQDRHGCEREDQAHRALEGEMHRIAHRSADLAQALAAEQEERRVLEAEVKCLHDQVAQLTEIVRMLMREDEPG